MTTTSIAIIGDYFMLPSVFQEKIEAVCDTEIDFRTHQQDWPNVEMEHGYAAEGMEGLKEYFGTPDEVIDIVGDAEIFVTHLAPVPRTVMEALPKLKLIAVSRGGPVNVDMAAAKDHNITVVNTPGRNASAVAEFTLGAILAETRMIRVGHEALRQGEWRGDLYRADRTGRELNEMTVGVIGYGNVGTKVVRLLRAFGSRVLVHDPYVQISQSDRKDGVEHVSLDTLLSESDIVSLHPRVTEETKNMMDAEAFAKMKKGATFVNTARGPLTDYDALYDSLKSGHLQGAMLETFAVEPVPADWPLLQLPNVTLTPHIAGASVRTVTFAAEQAAEEVRRYLTGLPPVNQK